MEFVDYKCLESLLIEGEEIAQEGILKTASKVVGGTIDYKENRMIPAMESLNPFLYYTIFIEKNYMNYNTSMAKVKNTVYNLSDYKYFSDIMRVVIQDKWTESDFIKFIENNIKYTNKNMEIYYWEEDDDTDLLSEQDKKNQKIWDNLKLICVSEDGAGNTLFYSKSKHGFYFIDHEKSFEENMKSFMKWKDALYGAKKLDSDDLWI